MAANEQGLRYRTVDVFTERSLEGNALAVFTDASGLDTATMQRIARELNLAETTFVLPSTRADCVARLRIFTPWKELEFAGHPTIGTAYVLLDEGIASTQSGDFLLEENVGPIAVRVDRRPRAMLWLTTPPIRFGRCFSPELCAGVLGLSPGDLLDVAPQWLSAGNPTVFLALRTKDAVDRASLDLSGIRKLRGSESELFCLFVFTPTAEGAYARMFAPEYGVAEDPATGSSTGPLAAYMMRHRLIDGAAGTGFISEQGTKMGRRSLLHVRIRGEQGIEGIEVGGFVTPVATGFMRLNG